MIIAFALVALSATNALATLLALWADHHDRPKERFLERPITAAHRRGNWR